tara:strand:- start:911 stop:1207 length:297 start_codon:yes stop_codon:yes gene_type:complete
MIIGKIAQAVLKLIMPNVIEHIFKVGKLDKLLNYMELPNEADRGILKLQDEINILTGTVKDMVKDIHPPADFPISKEQAEELLGFMKKIKNKSKFKIG